MQVVSVLNLSSTPKLIQITDTFVSFSLVLIVQHSAACTLATRYRTIFHIILYGINPYLLGTALNVWSLSILSISAIQHFLCQCCPCFSSTTYNIIFTHIMMPGLWINPSKGLDERGLVLIFRTNWIGSTCFDTYGWGGHPFRHPRLRRVATVRIVQ